MDLWRSTAAGEELGCCIFVTGGLGLRMDDGWAVTMWMQD
jgi:hypothetical protein